MSEQPNTSGWTTHDWLIQRYKYIPSAPAAVLSAVLFGLTTSLHAVQLVKWKTWYFVPFLVGGLFETAGYIMRAIDTGVANKILFVNQTSPILLAPALYVASIYMILRRLILILDAEKYSLVPIHWPTKIFVGCDVLSFLAQGAGGAMQASKSSGKSKATTGKENIGNCLVIGGLVFQLAVFTFFMVVTGTFHLRIQRRPTTRSATAQVPWRQFIYVLYIGSVLIMIRSIFCVVEYIQGRERYLISHEAFAYILGTTIIFLVSIEFNFFHPSRIVSSRTKDTYLLDNDDQEESV